MVSHRILSAQIKPLAASYTRYEKHGRRTEKARQAQNRHGMSVHKLADVDVKVLEGLIKEAMKKSKPAPVVKKH